MTKYTVRRNHSLTHISIRAELLPGLQLHEEQKLPEKHLPYEIYLLNMIILETTNMV